MNISKITASILLAVGFWGAAFYSQANDEFQQWLKEKNQDFQNYLSEQDKELSELVSADWQAYKSSLTKADYQRPKPEQLPEVEVKVQPEDPVKPQALPRAEVPKPPVYQPPKAKGVSYRVTMVGLKAEFQVDRSLSQPLSGQMNNERLGDWWQKMAAKDYTDLTTQLTTFAQQNGFSDWDKLVLVKALSQKVHKREKQQILWQWLILTRMNLDVRPATINGELTLLFSSYQTLVNRPYITLNKTRYYLLDSSISGRVSINTFEIQSKSEAEALSVLPNPDLNVGDKWQWRDLTFTYATVEYSLQLPVNLDRVQYLTQYPQVELKDFMSVDAPTSLKAALKESLGSQLAQKSETETLSFLLRMAQTAFEYKTDAQQFGEERYLLAEEVLFYPYSDCEDRSQFLTAVMDSVSPRPMVALQFPNHLAIAAQVSTPMDGYSLDLAGRQFILLDSTYINADPGLLMPHLKNSKPKVMVIN